MKRPALAPEREGDRLVRVAAVVLLLALVQGFAFARQFLHGFRPFAREPVRIPFSWDMFATRIERCDLAWTPPRGTPKGPLGKLRDLSPALEWDVVYDSVEAYRLAGRRGCGTDGGPTKVRLTCFLPDGTERNEEFDCP